MLRDTKANKIFMLAILCILAVSSGAVKLLQRTEFKNVESKSFSVSEDTSLKIGTMSQDISVEVDPSATEGTASVKGAKGMNFKQSGNTVEIGLDPVSGGIPFFGESKTPRLIVTLPPTALKDLTVRSTSGNIDIMQDVSATSLTLQNVSGRIDFSDLKAERSLTLHSVSGRISGYSAEGDVVDISTVSGSFDLDRVAARTVKLKSVSASLETNVELTDGGSLSAGSTSGDLDLSISSDDGAHVTAETVSGGIAFNDEDKEGKKAVASWGDGKADVEAKTVSGDIDLSF